MREAKGHSLVHFQEKRRAEGEEVELLEEVTIFQRKKKNCCTEIERH